ncbi:MAG TPA: glycosyltransferase [Puia sp.]|nr:glycosyltransferase [Puia sp.]
MECIAGSLNKNADDNAMMEAGKKILLFADWYEPGYKAGGPIRSCVNFARYMRGDYRIYVFTSDRDLRSPEPYEGVTVNEWQRDKHGINVYYCSPGRLTWQNIRTQMRVVQPDFIYLNSMFSVKFTIYPLLITRICHFDHIVVLSPRGMLRKSAIQFKAMKKRSFLRAFRLLGLQRSVRFHATDETEARDIGRYFGKGTRVSMVPNFPGPLIDDFPVPAKVPGELALLFIGRIHPIKNLHLLLEILAKVEASVQLTIVGSLEDSTYWEKCRKLMAEFPESIRVDYAGEMANHELPAIIAKHHIFALPTKGENFGHAIFEALALGKPVLISDQTPWRGLHAAGAGWDLSLDRPEDFRLAIEEAAGYGRKEYEDLCASTWRYIGDYIAKLDLKDEYKKLFR